MLNLSIFGKPQAFRMLETLISSGESLNRRSLVEKLLQQLDRLRSSMTDRETTKCLQIQSSLLRSRLMYIKNVQDRLVAE